MTLDSLPKAGGFKVACTLRPALFCSTPHLTAAAQCPCACVYQQHHQSLAANVYDYDTKCETAALQVTLRV